MTSRSASIILLLSAAPLLAACQTPQQSATAEATIVCTQGGYGPGTPRHAECMSGVLPAALAFEQRRRQQLFNEGLNDLSRGLNPPQQPRLQTTCTRMGAFLDCS